MSPLYWRLIEVVALAVPVDAKLPTTAFSFSYFWVIKRKTTTLFVSLTSRSPCPTRQTASAQIVAGLFLADGVRLVEPCQNQRPSYLTFCVSLRETAHTEEDGHCVSAVSLIAAKIF